MTIKFSCKSAALCLPLTALLNACTISQPHAAPEALAADYAGASVARVANSEGEGWLVAGANAGVVLADGNWQVKKHLAIKAELLDVRNTVTTPTGGTAALLATVTEPGHTPTFYTADLANGELTEVARLPSPKFEVENLCLHQDSEKNTYVFLLDERGYAEHWLVMDSRGSAQPQLVRKVATPPNSKACSVSDEQSLLYVAEEGVGLWGYEASPEAAPGRFPVALAMPFGSLAGGTEVVAAVPGGVITVAADDQRLQAFRVDGDKVTPVDIKSSNTVEETEGLRAWPTSPDEINLVLTDDADGKHYQVTLPWQQQPTAPSSASIKVPVATVQPDVQTAPVARFGDAADDPAIWVNAKNPEKSLVLGTNKKQGLLVYNLQGEEVQMIPTGNINNVDVRYGLELGGKQVDLAVASLRDDNSLALYTIDRSNGEVAEAGRIPVDMKEIYGLCLYQARPTSGNVGSIYTIVNDKSGEFQQYRMSADSGKITAELVRRFYVESQPEGCVADDNKAQLFIGEEDTGVWTLGAEPDSGTELQSVVTVGELLVADVEGLGLYHDSEQSYLVISSQGNNSYLVLDAHAPYTPRGIFRIGINMNKLIDGASETDGLEVTSHNLGGLFTQGLLVVQDGHKVMPETPQNFKYVSWQKIHEALGL